MYDISPGTSDLHIVTRANELMGLELDVFQNFDAKAAMPQDQAKTGSGRFSLLYFTQVHISS
eukprot:m.292780 g.292780  ORF g.292780 m.292780 type:complete len:62 (-) comp27128_c0_seq3:3954-4139(-)